MNNYANHTGINRYEVFPQIPNKTVIHLFLALF